MHIQLKHKQSQILTQHLVQSVTILQMGTQELTEYLKEVSMENPVLEIEERSSDAQEKSRLEKMEWLAGLDEQNRIYYREEYEENDLLANVSVSDETLADNLIGQLIGTEYDKEDFKIFEYIAECLDSRGFFTGSVLELSSVFGISEEKAWECVEVMKNLEPAGICAESIEECLLKQLQRKKGNYEVEGEIIQNYLELLGKNQLHVIAKKMEISVERVVKAKEVIQTLNPKPGSGFSEREAMKYINPDIMVIKLEDHFEILVNNVSLPVMRTNSEYLKMLHDKKCDKEVRTYLADKVKQIEQIQSNIDRRNTTLQELAKCIVENQSDFFVYGKGHLKSYQMKEAAEKMGVHESTVSRAVKDKYLQCCWGIFPLGYFFSKGMHNNHHAGEEKSEMASDMVLSKMMELIAGENKKKPLSDQKIMDALVEQGIHISRRTVAKYRENAGIPDCRGRKEFS